MQEQPPFEADHDAFDVQELPPVLDAPRTSGPALAGAAGLLLLGIGGAVGAALAIGAPPLDELAAKSMKLGLTPGLAAVGGTVCLALAIAAHGLAGLLRRTIDTLELSSDPVPLLERIEDHVRDLDARIYESEQRAVRDLNNAMQPLAERLGSLENAVTAARLSMEEDDDPSRDAVWRLAASMDQIRAQLDQRMAEQLSTYEDHLAAGLERASQQHLEALESALRESQQQLAQQAALEQREALETRAQGEDRPSIEPELEVEEAPEIEVDAEPEPATEPRAELDIEAPGAPLPVAEDRQAPAAEEHKVKLKRPASVPPASAQASAPAPKPARASEAGEALAPDDSLGVFDQLDEHGQPKQPVPRPGDVERRTTPTEPMPDIYGGADSIADVDGVGGAKPRFKRKPN
ncbi:MAG: hypothetical protein AAFZ65_10420 [Planctomycetota bacterium]